MVEQYLGFRRFQRKRCEVYRNFPHHKNLWHPFLRKSTPDVICQNTGLHKICAACATVPTLTRSLGSVSWLYGWSVGTERKCDEAYAQTTENGFRAKPNSLHIQQDQTVIHTSRIHRDAHAMVGGTAEEILPGTPASNSLAKLLCGTRTPGIECSGSHMNNCRSSKCLSEKNKFNSVTRTRII